MRGPGLLDAAGVLVFVAVLAAITALVVLPAPTLRDDERPMMTFTVSAGAPVTFVVDPDTVEVKLVTLGERRPGVRPDAARAETYTLGWSWLGADGSVRADETLTLAAGPAVSPSTADAADAADLLVPRSVRLHPPGTPGEIAALRVEVPAGEPPVRVRAFRSSPAPWGTAELALLAVDQRDATTLARRLGLSSWHEVTRDEALALSAQRWEGMNPQRADLGDGARGTTIVPAPPLPAPTRRALGAWLGPSRALAWTLVGPGDVTVVGDGPLDAIAWRVVVEDVGLVDVTVEPVAPPSWRPDAQALRLRWATPGAASLQASHRRTVPIRNLVALLPADAEVAEDSEIVPVATFTPQGDGDDARRSVAPAWAEVPRTVIRPGTELPIDLPGPATVLRLELRAVQADPAARAAAVRVVVEGAGVPVVHDVTLDAGADAFALVGWDALPLDVDAWPSEPVARFVRLADDVRRVRVEVPDGAVPLLVAAAIPGPPRGTVEAWDAARVTTQVHPRDARTTWTPLDVRGEATALRVTRRRELLDGGGTPTRYTTVSPVADAGSTPGDPWLLPPVPQTPLAGLVYCEVTPGPATPLRFDAAASRELGGALSAVLWAPDVTTHPRLGDGFSLSVDDQPWIAGRFDAAVLRRTTHHDPGRSVALQGPDGARAWVRTSTRAGAPPPCPSPWRARRVVHVAPGASVPFDVPAGDDDRVVVVGGLGDGPVPVSIAVRAAHDAGDVLPAWTERTRVVTLAPQDGAEARALETPWQRAGVLAPSGLALHADVAGPVR
ncbi:MAG: hypothetical protein H6733_10775, partial [Alphaproteobacteria bacterium]|nr:hypothetical protein [Alphaproteobacteria bacterium]